MTLRFKRGYEPVCFEQLLDLCYPRLRLTNQYRQAWPCTTTRLVHEGRDDYPTNITRAVRG